MCAHWNYEQLRNVAEGAMAFVPAQSRIMRDRLRVRQSERMDLTALVAEPKKPGAVSKSESQTAVK